MFGFTFTLNNLSLTFILNFVILALTTLTSSTYAIIQTRKRCTIDIISYNNLSPTDFRDTYYLQKPVIITNLRVPLKTKHLWSLSNLSNKYGHIPVATSTSSSLTKNRGTGTIQKTLSELIRQVKKTTKQHAEVFAFERNAALFKHAPTLIQSANDIVQRYVGTNSTNSNWYLSIGKRHSGVHFHHHSDGWLFMFEGKKRWFFLPPYQKLPSFTHVARFPIRDWYEKFVYPKLLEEEMPLECVAKAGDFVYVPESWWHATMTVSKWSVAVAAQMDVPVTEEGKEWREAVDRWWGNNVDNDVTMKERLVQDRKTLARLNVIQKKQPNNAEAFHFSGSVFSKMNDPSWTNKKKWEMTLHELEMKEKAYELCPRNCDVMHNYGVVLAKARRLTESVKVLQKAVNLCGIFNHNLIKTMEQIQKIDAQSERKKEL